MGVGVRLAGTVAGASGMVLLGNSWGEGGLGALGAATLVVAGGTWTTGALRAAVLHDGPSDALEDMCRALAEALADTGGIPADLGANAIAIACEADGFYRCYLRGAGLAESRRFADSLAELLEPLFNPRYIIPRYVPEAHVSIPALLRLYWRQRSRGRVSDAVVYHAVPRYLAANKERAEAFGKAWNRYVSGGAPIYRGDPEARAVLEVQAGEAPLEAATQMRVVWT